MSAFDKLTEGLAPDVKRDVYRVLSNANLDPNDPAAVIAALMGHVQALGKELPAALRAAGDELIAKVQRATRNAGALEVTDVALGISDSVKREIVDGLWPMCGAEVKNLLRNSEATARHRWHVGVMAVFLATTVAVGALGYFTGRLWWDAELKRLEPAAQRLVGTESGKIALKLVQHNDLTEAVASCREGNNAFTVGGRRACYVPLWLEGPPPPDKRYADRVLAWVRGLMDWLNRLNAIGLLLAGFLAWPIVRKLTRRLKRAGPGK